MKSKYFMRSFFVLMSLFLFSEAHADSTCETAIQAFTKSFIERLSDSKEKVNLRDAPTETTYPVRTYWTYGSQFKSKTGVPTPAKDHPSVKTTTTKKIPFPKTEIVSPPIDLWFPPVSLPEEITAMKGAVLGEGSKITTFSHTQDPHSVIKLTDRPSLSYPDTKRVRDVIEKQLNRPDLVPTFKMDITDTHGRDVGHIEERAIPMSVLEGDLPPEAKEGLAALEAAAEELRQKFNINIEVKKENAGFKIKADGSPDFSKPLFLDLEDQNTILRDAFQAHSAFLLAPVGSDQKLRPFAIQLRPGDIVQFKDTTGKMQEFGKLMDPNTLPNSPQKGSSVFETSKGWIGVSPQMSEALTQHPNIFVLRKIDGILKEITPSHP